MKRVIISLLLISSIVFAKSIVLTLDAPAGDISGLAWGNDMLWAVDQETDTVYSIDPTSGIVENSFYVSHSSVYFPTGLAFSENYNYVCVGLWNGYTTGYVYKYTTTGIFSGSVSMCGG